MPNRNINIINRLQALLISVFSLIFLLSASAVSAVTCSSTTDISTESELRTAMTAAGDTCVRLTTNVTLTGGEMVIGTGSKRVQGSGRGTTINANSLSRVFVVGTGTEFEIYNITLKNGSVSSSSTYDGNGGLVYNNGGNVLIRAATINTGISATGIGGNVYSAAGSLTISDGALLTNGKAANGGGIAIDGGSLTITGTPSTPVNFTYDKANSGGAGGGIYVNNTTNAVTVSITGAKFENCQITNGSGQAIYFSDSVAGSSLSISQSTFNSNGTSSSGGQGAALFVNAPSVEITNSTFDANKAASGGAIYVDGGSAVLTYNTISENSSGTAGAGLYVNAGSVTLSKNIIAGNTGSDCVSAVAITSGDYNLIGDGTGCQMTAAANDQIGTTASPVDAMLDALAANNTTLKTMAIAAGSPARDAIPTASCGIAYDERGYVRPSGAGCDIGAFEGIVVVTPVAADFSLSQIAFTYNGSTQTPAIITTLLDIGSITNSIYLNGTVTTTPVDANTYTVKVTTTANDYYNAVTDLEIGTYTINKAALTAADFVITPTTAYYSGSALVPTVSYIAGLSGTGTLDSTAFYLNGTAVASPTNGGAYDVQVTTSEGTNYLAASGLSVGTYTILQGSCDWGGYDIINVATEAEFRAAVANNTISCVNVTANITFTDGPVVIDSTTGNKRFTASSKSIYLDGNNLYGFMRIQSGATVLVDTITLKNGLTPDSYKGAIHNEGSLTVNNAIMSGNSSTGGGAIYSAGTDLTVSNSDFDSNTATLQGGGAISVSSASNPLTVSYCSFTGNNGGDNTGGAVSSLSKTTIDNSSFSANTGKWGGGLYTSSGDTTTTITDSTFTGNQSSQDGGGFLTHNAYALTNVVFENNYAKESGGGMRTYAAGTITGGNFTGNNCATEALQEAAFSSGSTEILGYGGGIFTNSNITINGTDFTSNYASKIGGGVLLSGASDTITATISHCNFLTNKVHGNGAAIYAEFILNIDNSLIQGNESAKLASDTENFHTAGGIYNITQLTMDTVDIIGNTAYAAGGGIWSRGALDIKNSNIKINTSGEYGGGVYSGSDSNIITDTLFQKNSAVTFGGGFYSTSGTAELTRVTFDQNLTAANGGGAATKGNIVIDGCHFTANTSGSSGAGFNCSDNSAKSNTCVVKNSDFTGNISQSYGGGISTSVKLDVTDTNFTTNTARYGGAVTNYTATAVVTITNGTMDGNKVVKTDTSLYPKGGAVYNHGTTTIDNVTIQNNTSEYQAGGIFSDSPLEVKNSTITTNTAGKSGGGLLCTSGNTTLTSNSFTSNVSGQYGGGIYYDGGTLSLDTNTITGNTSVQIGGGIFAASGSTVTLTGGSISNNQATGSSNANGGGIGNAGNFTLTNASITNNSTAGAGGGIISYGTNGNMTVSGSTIASNSALYAGGIENTAVMNIQSSVIKENTAANDSAGILNEETTGILNITDTSVEGNVSQGYGGGVINLSGGKLTMLTSTISGNTALNSAGLYNSNSESETASVSTLTNCTIAGNTDSGGGYAGVRNERGTTNLYHVTISGNSSAASASAGIANESGGTTNLFAVLVAGNSDTSSGVDTDCESNGTTKITSLGYNLIGMDGGTDGSTSCLTAAQTTDRIGSIAVPLSAGVNALADNGGSTKTMALQETSMAVDGVDTAASAAYTTTDQRGTARPLGSAADIGAYESSYTLQLITKIIQKVWDDSENQDGLRVESVQIQLKADGTDYGDPVTLNEANGWQVEVTDLPKLNNGTEIVYSIVELTPEATTTPAP